jgi:hypothetical protein
LQAGKQQQVTAIGQAAAAAAVQMQAAAAYSTGETAGCLLQNLLLHPLLLLLALQWSGQQCRLLLRLAGLCLHLLLLLQSQHLVLLKIQHFRCCACPNGQTSYCCQQLLLLLYLCQQQQQQ